MKIKYKFIIMFSIFTLCCITLANMTFTEATLSVSVVVDQNLYVQRQTVKIYGNVTYGGLPTDGLVGIEISDPWERPIMYRALVVGNETTDGVFSIIEILPCDMYLNAKYSFKIGETAYFKVTVKNNSPSPRRVAITATLLDGNMIAIRALANTHSSVLPGSTVYSVLEIHIPSYAYVGKAKAIACAFSDLPENGGMPYCPEKSITLEITRSLGITTPPPPETETPLAIGAYNLSFKVSPESIPGTYKVYINARKGDTFSRAFNTFSVESTPNPPQASFTYMPLNPFVNQTVTFDASASSPENWNDEIIQYEWDFGDNTPQVVKSGTLEDPPDPIVYHTYTQAGTYIVTLNVTDNDGLWCLTSKPITILPPTGPKAAFTWFPTNPFVNQTITFNASSSQPGWNGTGYTAIVSYQWNFGDGNITTVTTPIIYHSYTLEGNYNVTLTVTDSQGLSSSKTLTINVRPLSPLVGDINGDGIVDYLDINIVCRAFGSYPGHPKWDSRADLNGDDFIDYLDINICARNYGKTL